jgi:hypothetical protein
MHHEHAEMMLMAVMMNSILQNYNAHRTKKLGKRIFYKGVTSTAPVPLLNDAVWDTLETTYRESALL